MPTLIAWQYQPDEDEGGIALDASRRGEQLAFPGDDIIHDTLGNGKLVV